MRFIIVLVGFIFIFSCKKDPVAPVDCAGVSGGSAKLDNCDTCDGDTQNDCVDCTSHFAFNISISSAYYYFQSVTINGVTLDATDWVGAFNGDICVGARQWDISQCGGGVCDVPAMGIDNNVDDTQDYCESGDILSFKIYDVSEGLIYNTRASGDIAPWQNFGTSVIDTLVATTTAPCQ